MNDSESDLQWQTSGCFNWTLYARD